MQSFSGLFHAFVELFLLIRCFVFIFVHYFEFVLGAREINGDCVFAHELLSVQALLGLGGIG